MIGRPTRFVIGSFILLFIGILGRLDIMPFATRADGSLIKAEQKSTTATLSRSSQQYTFEAINIEYQYIVGEKLYVGRSPYFNFEGWRSSDDTRNLLRSVSVGKEYTIWYDSRQPEVSWLFWYWPHILMFFVLILVGLALIWSAVGSWLLSVRSSVSNFN